MSYIYTKAYSQYGAPLYVAWGDGQEMFFRARGVFKNAKFYR